MMEVINNIDEWNTVFQNHNKEKNILLLNFSALWCNPCKALKPELEKLSNNPNYSNVKMYKIDIDKCEDIATMLDISSIPTTLLVKDDKIVHRISGANILTITNNIDSIL